jgi:hypothetical protein
MSNPYDDIIHLPRPTSQKRAPMPAPARAAQFSPFAALTGYEAAITESSRLTEQKKELDQATKLALNSKLQLLAGQIQQQHQVHITFFQPDKNKPGGAYVTASGTVKKIDTYKRLVLLSTGTAIPIDNISCIEGQIFDTLGSHA